MGASSSLVATRDHNIEMNIVDEAQSNGRASIHRHSSQPASILFSTFKPRQKHQDSTLRPSNLQSSGSFDPSTPPIAGPVETVGNVRKEFDTLKLTKEQEIQALQRKEQKLDMENNRLRAELHALNKQCQKLRAERDTAMESSYLATERATALEQDREKIQRQFKIFRETKEAEIQALLQAKRQLESEFHRMQAHGMATIDDHNSTAHDTSFTGQTSFSANAGDHSHWWAVPESETTSLFGSHAQLQNGSQLGYSESIQDGPEIRKHDRRSDMTMDLTNLTSAKDALLSTSASLSNILVTDATEICDSTLLRCYISATPDAINKARNFLNHPDLKKLTLACEKEGYFLSIAHFTDIQDYYDATGNVQSNCNITVIHAINRSSVFISFLGSSMGKYTETELNEALFKSTVTKSTLFCIEKSGSASRPNQSLVKLVQANASKRCFNYVNEGQCCQAALKEVSKAVRLEFGVSVDSTSSSMHDSNEVLCLEEMVMEPSVERSQNEIASSSSSASHIQPVGLEKCYDRLDEVITSPGPVPPLLVSGSPSSGKTMLLSSWAAKLKVNRPDVAVLQHFVTNPNSIDSKPVIVLRRLLSQLCQHLPNGTHLPLYACTTYDATRLREILPRWIDQLSSRRNKRILLTIDSIDRLKDVQRYFCWLLDPLPVGVRVVISVDVDSCPEEWRQFPTLHLEPLSIHGVKNLLKEHAQTRSVVVSQAWERDIVSHCRTATTCHPLYVTLLSALACSICEDRASLNLFHLCSKKQDSREVYHILLRDVEAKCANKEAKQRFKFILQVLVCSRNGLSETELMSLFPDLTWLEWTWLFGQLTQFCVLREHAGVIVPHNSEVSALLYNKYVGNDVHERRCRQKMITWMLRVHERQATPRSTELLLWLLHKDEERSTLLDVLKSPMVFHILYMSGRNSEMVELWNYLNEDKQAIAKYYYSELRKMENKTHGQMIQMTEIAQMYQTLGRFLKDMGLMEEAVASLQKSLEIQETVLDPDHPAVADSLHYLASVYSQWGKLTTAQSLYKQALELIESVVGRDHLRVAQELGALSRVTRKIGNQEEAESLHRRETAIANRSSANTSTRLDRLRRRALRLEELTLSEDSVEVANALNDLGVLYFLQNNFESAESFFLRCLKIREKLVGSHHIEVAQSYHNLASLYNRKKNYVQAVEYMNKALKIRRKHSSDDVGIVPSLKHMAVLYKKLNQFDHAREIYEQLLEISIKTTGQESDLTANAMVNLAVVECQNKNLDFALPLYRKALKIYQDTFGRESPQVTQTLKNIAILLFQKGDLTQAALLYKESMGDKLDQAKLSNLTW